jgi:hypothetical protein
MDTREAAFMAPMQRVPSDRHMKEDPLFRCVQLLSEMQTGMFMIGVRKISVILRKSAST